MPSEAHEEIVDDIRCLLNHKLQRIYPSLGITIDTVVAKYLFGFTVSDRRADLYALPSDGGGLILFEIGHMNPGHWDHITTMDSLPIRVVRITFGRACGLLHPRHTQFEKDMMELLCAELASGECTCDMCLHV